MGGGRAFAAHFSEPKRVVRVDTWQLKGCRRRYCSKLSIKLKIQDGARRALGGLKGCRCIFLVIFTCVKEMLYMWIKVMA